MRRHARRVLLDANAALAKRQSGVWQALAQDREQSFVVHHEALLADALASDAVESVITGSPRQV